MVLSALFLLTGCKKEIKLETKHIHETDSTAQWITNIERPTFAATEKWAEKSCVRFNDKVTSFIQGVQDTLIRQAKQGAATMEAAGEQWNWPYELFVRDSIFMADENYISVRFLIYTFTGGAHGMTTFHSLNYDFKNEKFLTNAEILNTGKSAEINDLLKAHLQNPEKCFTENPTLSAASVINIGLHNLYFTFEPYVLGPYSCGYATIEIPRSKLKDMLVIQ